MPELDPAIISWQHRITELSADLPGLGSGDLSVQRAARTRLADQLTAEFGLPVDPRVTIDEIALRGASGPTYARRYRPTAAAPTAALPTQLFLHGGGFLFGSPRELVNDQLLSRRSARTGIQIISLAYGLAPEHPYPVGRNDALAALTHLADKASELGIDPDRLGLGGNSAGASTVTSAALAVTLGIVDAPRAHHLMLEVPAGSLRVDPAEVSVEAQAELRAILAAYLPGGEVDAAASPADAPSLKGMPSTTVITAEHDQLRPGAVQLVRRLEADGVPTSWHDMPGHVHASCFLTAVLPGARDWQGVLVGELRTTYNSHPFETVEN
ncbi:alpha/beta hydrolase [Propionibacteriaceae bacterium Y1685]